MMWTLDELVERVAGALAASAYPGAPNGRVRDLPDRRVIRWYSTIGLVDRPAATRGRTALYGPRHLLQLVAVKRRQAQGRSLAEIQAELTGAPDDRLRAIAAVPPQLLAPAPPAPAPPRHGAEDRAADAAPPAEQPDASRSRFWAAAVTPSGPTPAPTRPERPDTVTALAAVPLADRVLLLLPAAPGAEDLADIRAAAAPLLDLLAGRGLLGQPDGLDPQPRRSAPDADPRSAT
jgi:DNA-binding transcriptional MerR regulator